MTLAQAPSNSICQITSIDISNDSDLVYLRNGLRAGSWLQVICRHPSTNPLILEVRLENLLHISVPITFAECVRVRSADINREAL